MEVVGVVGVAARAEHRVELGAGAGKGSLEEGPLGWGPTPPVAIHVDLPPVGEAEGQRRRGHCRRHARTSPRRGYCGCGSHKRRSAGSRPPGCRNRRGAAGCTELAIQRSTEAVIGQPMVAGGVTATVPFAVALTLNGMLEPAGAAAAERRHRLHEGRRPDLAAREARSLDLTPPGRARLGKGIGGARGDARHDRHAGDDIENSDPHAP